MPDCWLEVSFQLEDPATGQLDHGLPWFSLVPEQMLSWYPNSTLHCHASHAALPMVALKCSPCTNVTLTLGWREDMGDMGEGALYREDEPAPRRTGRQTVGRTVTWNWTCLIALKITDPSSRQRGRPTWKIKKVSVTQINVTSCHLLQKGQDTKKNWPTDRQS
jgi:hypothetical protein